MQMKKKKMMMMVMLISVTFTTLSGASMHVPASAPSPYSVPIMGPAAAAGGEPMAPAPAGLDCTDALLNMTACLTYVEEGSNQTVPDTGCCPGLSGLITNQPVCLCQLLASGNAFGVKLDTTKALMLPNVCKLQAPPVSLCAVLGIPVASPTGLSAAPTSGGAEAPSSSASSDIAGSTPTAAPLAGNAGSSSTNAATFSLLALTTFSVIAAIF